MSRKGFTLIELLVVIAIIAVFIALLLPAVQRAREAATRTQCRNNLHQIGLALHNYHDTHGCFPSSTSGGMCSDGTPCYHTCGPNAAWSLMILPFMDEAALYNANNFDYRPYDPGNRTVIVQVLAQYRCPSDTGPERVACGNGACSGWRALVGASSYACNVGAVYKGTVASNHYHGGMPFDECWPAAPPAGGNWGRTFGPFYTSSKVRVKMISDGTSNTMACGEMCYVARAPSAAGVGQWAIVYTYYGSTGETFVPMNTRVESSSMTAPQGAFSSEHEGGAFFLFADGAVKFLSENIDMGTYRALSTIWGNEVIDDEDY